MLTWNALRAAGFGLEGVGPASSFFVPAPLDPRPSPTPALGSMLTWNALRASRGATVGFGTLLFPLFDLAKKETADRWPAVSQPGAAVRTGDIPPV
jgi:hypothetical protein